MNTTEVLEVLIPMLAMLVTLVGLALRVQANLRRTLEESIEKFSNQVGKDREEDLTAAQANREEDRRELQAFRTEVLDRFETTNHKIDANTAAIAANTAAIAANTTAIAANATETNGNITLNTTKIDANTAETNAKIDAIAAAADGDRERFETFRGDTREDFKELGDKIDTNAATHDRNIRKVGDQVAGARWRVPGARGQVPVDRSGDGTACGMPWALPAGQ